MRQKKKKWNPAKAKRKLDRLFSQLVLGRDERTCQWCGRNAASAGKPVHVDTSHIIPRENLGLRWSLDNAVALCWSCHKRRGTSWHGSPVEAVAWLRSFVGDQRCDQLLLDARRPFEFTPEAAAEIESELKERLGSVTGHGQNYES